MKKYIVLISCVKQKLSHSAPAGELYTSPLFRKNLDYANKLSPDKIFVLSAKHGLVPLTKKLGPYEDTLNSKKAKEIKSWAQGVLKSLRQEVDLANDRFTILAGENYRKYLLPQIRRYHIPMEGLSIGKQLKFLTDHNDGKYRDAIGSKLVNHGKNLYKLPPQKIEFTENPEANKLVNDINRLPHAYVIGCIVDQQVKAELAWSIPYHLAKKVGSFEFSSLETLSLKDIESFMADSGHRFWKNMSSYIHSGIQRIRDQYDGDARRIWNDKPTSAELVYRFLSFNGIGQKIATMAANILARDFKVKLADYYAIDVSVDRHVRNVFKRLGLVGHNAKDEQIIMRAKSIYPKYPGLMDLAAFEIGRNWCSPNTEPECEACFMNDLCMSSLTKFN